MINDNSSGKNTNIMRNHGVLSQAAAKGFVPRNNAQIPNITNAVKDHGTPKHPGNVSHAANTKKFRDAGKEMFADRSGKDDPFQKAASFVAGRSDSQNTKSTKTYNTVTNHLRVPSGLNQ